MKTYYIKIVETRSQIVEVHADSLDEAVDKAENVYYDGTLELQAEDVDETFFDDVTDDTLESYDNGGMPKFYEIQ